jgi:hypothetical protein
MQHPAYPPNTPVHSSAVAQAVFGAPVPYVSQLPLAAAPVKDSADLFVETLPTPGLRAAIISAIATGGLLVLMAFRLILNVEGSVVVNVIECLMLFSGAAHFLCAGKLGNGRLWAALLLFALVPVVLIAALFTLVTGLTATALTGEPMALLSFFPAMAGGVLGVVECVLTAVSLPVIRRIGRAKAELKRLEASA